MTLAVIVSLAGLVFTLLTALVVSTWRFSALTTRLLSRIESAKEKEDDLDEKLKILEQIPVMRRDLDVTQAAVKDATGAISKLQTRASRVDERTKTLEDRIGSIKSMVSPWNKPPSPSRPDPDPDEEA